MLSSLSVLAQDPDAQPKVTIELEAVTEDILVEVEASEIKPSDVFIDIDGQGFVFAFRLYTTHKLRIFKDTEIREKSRVIIKAEKATPMPSDLLIDVVEPVIKIN